MDFLGYKHPVLRRWYYTLWHKFTSRRFSVRLLLLNFLIFVTWMIAFIVPAFKSGKISFKLAFGAGIAYIFYGILRHYPSLHNFQRKHFIKQKIAREIMTSGILDKMLEDNLARELLTPAKGIPLLEEILEVIANSVRTYRCDTEGDKIFCNLLIEHDEGHLKVIARNKGGKRKDYPIYKKDGMLAWTSITHKRVCESGDIFIEFPSTPANKPYKSILTIPIIYRDSSVAVLSIDSSEPYHFTGIEETINTRLLSYMGLVKKVLVEYNILSS